MQKEPNAGPPGAVSHLKYSGAAGVRRYDLYVPSGYRGGPVPVVVMLHGTAQDAADFASGTGMNVLAEEHTFLVVYPQQSRQADPTRTWHWFRTEDQQAAGGEPEIIAAITREVARHHVVDPSRVYVAGMSAGGAMAAVMAATYPDLYAAVAVHSGLAYGAAHDLTSAFTAMQTGGTPRPGGPLPLIVMHGGSDVVVGPANVDTLIASRTSAGDGTLTEVVSAGEHRGRGYDRVCYQDASGEVVVETWTVRGGGHTWFGGDPAGSFTDPTGPAASAEIIRFFFEHPKS